VISVVIPIGGRFSQFVRLCYDNVVAHSGDFNDYEIVFLTSNECGKEVAKEIEALPNRVRRVNYPYKLMDATHDHQTLLDWCLNTQQVREWALVQHADIFWTKNWAQPILDGIQKYPDAIVLTQEFNRAYSINGKNLPLLSDFATTFKTSEFHKYNLTFRAGVSKHCKKPPKQGLQARPVRMSQELESLLKQKRVAFNGNPVDFEHRYDGCHVLTLEGWLKFPDKIGFIEGHEYLHLVQFFRLAVPWQRERLLRPSHPVMIRRYFFEEFDIDERVTYSVPVDYWTGDDPMSYWFWYSWITSHTMDRGEVDLIFPWRIFCRLWAMVEEKGKKTVDVNRLIGIAENMFARHPNCLGNSSTLGVRQITFREGTYNLSEVMMI